MKTYRWSNLPLSRLPLGGEAQTILTRTIDLETQHPITQKRTRHNAISL